MRWPLTWARTRDAELAAKDALIAEKDETIAATRASRAYHKAKAMTLGAALSEMEAERTEALSQRDAAMREVERLRKYEPVRREDGRFTAKAVRLRPASPPVGIAGHGSEDFA